MFCPKCGKENNDGSKFCKYCGCEMKQRTNAGNDINNQSASNNTKDRNEKILIGVLIAAIAILAIVFVAFGTGLFNGDSNAPTGDAQGSSSSSAPASTPVSLSSFPVSQAPALAQVVKNSGGNFPVQFQSLSLSKAQCLYILTKSIYLIGSGNPDATISVGDPSYAPHPSGRDYSQNIQRENYVDMCSRFSSWMESNGAVPNYIGIYAPGTADVSPSRMLDICVSILIDYGNTNNLPASVNI